MLSKHKHTPLLLILLSVCCFSLFSGCADNTLAGRYAEMAWEEREAFYRDAITTSADFPASGENLVILADVELDPKTTEERDNLHARERRVLYSYDAEGSHTLVYANAFWGEDQVSVEPLHENVRGEDGESALVQNAADWSEDAVIYGEVYDETYKGIKIYILIEKNAKPLYLNEEHLLINGGFLIDEKVVALWLVDEDGRKHPVYSAKLK